VVINLPRNVTITHSTGSDSIRSLSGSDALGLSGGSLSISSNSVYRGPVTLAGATLTGTGNLELDGLFTWNAGTMRGTGTTLAKGSVVLDNNAGFFQQGPTLDGRTFDNSKSAIWVGGSISSGGHQLVRQRYARQLDVRQHQDDDLGRRQHLHP
jgi:hypothetical protein